MASPPEPVPARDIIALLEHAVLAPSSHNTQPWRFWVEDGRVGLHADRTRALAVNDPDDRELTISCGCALMNLRVAAAEAGMATQSCTLPDVEEPDWLAEIRLRSPATDIGDEAALFPALPRRRTWRKRFQEREVPAPILGALTEAARREGVWLELLASPSAREAAAALVAEGDAVQWANPSWRRELAAWMHPRRKGDGLAMPGLAVPVAQMVVRSFDMGGGVGAKDRQLAEGSPVLAVLGTDGDRTGDWLAAGQALERLLLRGCLDGLQASYLNQPIQVAALRPRLQQLLGRPGFPQILLRLGFPGEADLAATPRRPVAEVLD